MDRVFSEDKSHLGQDKNVPSGLSIVSFLAAHFIPAQNFEHANKKLKNSRLSMNILCLLAISKPTCQNLK